MGKLTRGALWVLFPPAGIFASYRAGRRKDTDRIVAAVGGGTATHPRRLAQAAVAGQLDDELSADERLRFSEVRRHRGSILNKLKTAGVPRGQRDIVYLAVADLVASDGLTIDAAIAEALRRRDAVSS